MSKEYRNPALKFMNTNKDKEVKIESKRGPKPKIGEKKTKPVNLILKPTVYEKFKKVAYMKKLSVNALISKLMEDYIQENQECIEKYDEM